MFEVVRWWDGSRYTTAIMQRGRTKIHLVTMEPRGVWLYSMDRAEERKLLPVQLRGQPYPLKRALKTFRSAGRRHGITAGARNLLRAAWAEVSGSASDPPVESDPDLAVAAVA